MSKVELPTLYTYEKAGELLGGFSAATVARLVDRGKLASTEICSRRRISDESLREYLRLNTGKRADAGDDDQSAPVSASKAALLKSLGYPAQDIFAPKGRKKSAKKV